MRLRMKVSVTFLVLATPLHAQTSSESVAALSLVPAPVLGSRVRFREFEPSTMLASKQRREGQLIALRSDSLVLRAGRQDAGFALGRIASFEVRRKDRERGFYYGAIAGLLGGLTGIAVSEAAERTEGPSDAAILLLTGGLGGLFGAAVGWDVWEPVAIQRR